MTSNLTSSSRAAVCAALFCILAMTACTTVQNESFYHQAHRAVYAFSDQDLEGLQFYISREVLAHRINADGTTSAEDVIVLPFDTPGTVVEVGRDWLRVAFRDGGSGVVFLATDRGEDSLYKLATEIPGRVGFHRLEGVSAKVLLDQGNRYKIIHGENAFLLIDQEDLAEVIAERTHLEGAEND